MNPIPLTHKGRVYAWACGRCHMVHAGVTQGNRHSPKVITSLAEHSREQAEACCRCHDCERPIKTRFGYCEGCEEKQKQHREQVQADSRAAAERTNDSVKTAKDAVAAVALEEHMSEISEECWAAGWMVGTEYTLWEMLQGGPREWGMSRVSHADIGRLRDLHEEAGGWWIYEEDGARFVTTEKWIEIYGAGQK